MKTVVMGIGIPGSGKTTMLAGIARRGKSPHLIADDLRRELAGHPHDQSMQERIWEELVRRSLAALEEHPLVLVDATFTNQKVRRMVAVNLRAGGANRVFALYLQIPLNVAQERNAAREIPVKEPVLEEKLDELKTNPPTEADGFDRIFDGEQLAELEAAIAE